MNYSAALAYFPKITYARQQKLSAYFLKLENLWSAEMDELAKAGLENEIAHEFIVWRENFDLEKMMVNLEKEQIKTINLNAPEYPYLLKQINDPPRLLFARGVLPETLEVTVAIVGTRKCSAYGRQVTEELAENLAAAGVVVVSGLALGIDGCAHAAALKAQGKTIAVLGSGVDRRHIYPASHRLLAEDIIARGGAVISEYPPGFMPTQYSFPERNRVIAGLSAATLVTEAPGSSGALITAKCALDYNREVMSVPHPITSLAGAGCNNLIRMGAGLITKAQDVLDILQIQNTQQNIFCNQVLPSNPTEAKILPLLSKEPKHIDQIIKDSALDSASANSVLTIMEMKGKVRNVGGMMYILK